MTQEHDNLPIDHSNASRVMGVAGGAATGAVKTGAKAWGSWMLGTIATGAAVGFLMFSPIAAPVVAAVGTAVSTAAGAVFSWPVLASVVGAGLFGFGGYILSPLVATVGAAWGAVTGGEKAAHTISMQQARANEMKLQVAAYKAMAANARAAEEPEMTRSSPDYGFPAQGAGLNPAASKIQLDRAMLQGHAIERSQQVAV